jgi:corticotropin releasing hormone receptor 1
MTQVFWKFQAGEMFRSCPWTPHPFDWIYQGPAIAVLIINVIFLGIIMWVLITKLRSANNVETQQYRKAAKALLVLIPLLGVTYILVIVGPTEGISRRIYDSLRAILLSTQVTRARSNRDFFVVDPVLILVSLKLRSGFTNT